MPYQKKLIKKIKILENNHINYQYKFEDRTELNLMLNKSNADEIIIVKNGLITDASFANIVLSDGSIYLTPSTPLLKGTKRARLLDEGLIKEEELKKNDLRKFKYIYFINALLDIEEENKIEIERIFE